MEILLQQFFIENNSVVKNLIIVFFLSILPGIEGRYAIIYGILNGVKPYLVLAIASLGSLTISIVLPKVFKFLDNFILNIALKCSKYNFIFKKLIKVYIDYRLNSYNRVKKYIYRYGLIGLYIFVAIPLPITGIWTGSLAAYLLGINDNKLLPLILFLGGLTSNILIYLLSIVFNVF